MYHDLQPSPCLCDLALWIFWTVSKIMSGEPAAAETLDLVNLHRLSSLSSLWGLVLFSHVMHRARENWKKGNQKESRPHAGGKTENEEDWVWYSSTWTGLFMSYELKHNPGWLTLHYYVWCHCSDGVMMQGHPPVVKGRTFLWRTHFFFSYSWARGANHRTLDLKKGKTFFPQLVLNDLDS